MSQCDGRRGHAHEQPLLDRGHVPQHAALHVRQDFFFARECTRFIALNVANAPFKLFPTLLGGLTAIDDELQWFQVTIDGKGNGDNQLHKSCLA